MDDPGGVLDPRVRRLTVLSSGEVSGGILHGDGTITRFDDPTARNDYSMFFEEWERVVTWSPRHLGYHPPPAVQHRLAPAADRQRLTSHTPKEHTPS